VIEAINQGGCDGVKGGGSCTHKGEKRTVFRILMRTAEVKSRLEDIVLNRTILLKWILKFRMGGSGPDWTHSADGSECQG